jgi:hypothetical protein
MASLSASVLWCGVAGTLRDDAAYGPVLLAQEGREFGCSGCNIIELLISGHNRMTLKTPVQMLQWAYEDFISCDIDDAANRPAECGSKKRASSVEEFAARRGLMRMLHQEDHEVFMSFADWRDVPMQKFSSGWKFSETFDGRLLLHPFYHRARVAHDSIRDVTLLMHMDASRLKNLDLALRSWSGPVSIVVLMCVSPLMYDAVHSSHIDTLLEDTLQVFTPPSNRLHPFCSLLPPSPLERTSILLVSLTLLSIIP